MSRVGKMPVAVPQGRGRARSTEDQISVKGAGGTLARRRERAGQGARTKDGKLTFAPANESRRSQRHERHDARSWSNNMVSGVTKGFEKKLTLVGVGFRAAAQGSKLNLQIGFSHPVIKDMPAGITVAVPDARPRS